MHVADRITDAKRVAGLLDFSVDANGRYRSDDPSKLQERLVNVAQIIARSFTQQRPLGEVLIGSEALVQQMRDAVRESEVVQMLGVEVLGLSILSIKATPEMAKALQAEARETMLKKADEAVYVRRNAAIEQERAIKENELRTEIAVRQKQREVREAEMESEIAVAHKRREVRETQMAAEIAVEQQRTELVDQRVANERKEAEARAEALKATLEPMKDMDWRTLMALGGNGMDPKSIIAMAFRDLADNAEKVGNLSITPELLGSLLGEAGKARGGKGAK